MTLAIISPLLALGGGAASGGAVAAETAAIRVATFNVQVRRPVSDFSAGVLPLLDRSDIIGLQEVDTYDKEQVLQSAASSGWSYFRARPGLQEPVLWRTDRFTFAGGRIATVSTAGYIGNEVPNMKSYQHARTVTVVRLVDKVTGRHLSVVNAHLISGAIRGGRPWVGRPKLFRIYRQGLVGLMGQVVAERAWGRVYALGDFNAGWVADRKFLRRKLPLRTMFGLSMTSMWAWSRPSNGLGTHNDALIDQIFTTNRPTSARVQFDLAGHSDHLPAIASYATP